MDVGQNPTIMASESPSNRINLGMALQCVRQIESCNPSIVKMTSVPDHCKSESRREG